MKFDSAHRSGMQLAALLALTLAAGCRAADPPPSPTASAPPTAPDGAAVYTLACARCHGPDGAGDGELAARIGVPTLRTPRVAAMDPALMTALIRDGRGAMPPHGNRLPAAQIDAVVVHVRGLLEAR